MSARQTPPAPMGPPPPAAGDGQPPASAKKIYAVFFSGPMHERTLVGCYTAATPLDACKKAYPCCFDFEEPFADEYTGVSVYEVPAEGSVAQSRYVRSYELRRVDWPQSRKDACDDCRRNWF